MWTYELCFAALVGFAGFLYYLRIFLQGAQFRDTQTRLDGKTVIVTGCNTGIGWETALELARRGARVHMACRNRTATEAARQRIVDQTGNSSVFVRQLDLASLRSIRAFVQSFRAAEKRLDVLVNNAGVMNMPQSTTDDGFETHLGVNHLGHFLLTNLLLDVLRATPASRIVVVSSKAHTYTDIDRTDLMRSRSYNCWTAYCQSKLANVLFVRQLARLLYGTGVTVNCLHPGVIITDLVRHSPWIRAVSWPVKGLMRSARSGAQTQLRLAIDPELASISGRYFDDCAECEVSDAAKNDETAEWLWRRSEELVGLYPVNFRDQITKF